MYLIFAGGDGNDQYSTMYDAEVYAQYKGLSIYPNENGDQRDQYQNYTAFRNWVVLKAQSAGFAMYSDTGLSYKAYSLNLFQFGNEAGPHEGTWYFGVNRVIDPHDSSYPSGNRDGEGLCSICIRWLEQQDLNPPTEVPVMPSADEGPSTPSSSEDCDMESGTCKVCCKYNVDVVKLRLC